MSNTKELKIKKYISILINQLRSSELNNRIEAYNKIINLNPHWLKSCKYIFITMLDDEDSWMQFVALQLLQNLNPREIIDDIHQIISKLLIFINSDHSDPICRTQAIMLFEILSNNDLSANVDLIVNMLHESRCRLLALHALRKIDRNALIQYKHIDNLINSILLSIFNTESDAKLQCAVLDLVIYLQSNVVNYAEAILLKLTNSNFHFCIYSQAMNIFNSLKPKEMTLHIPSFVELRNHSCAKVRLFAYDVISNLLKNGQIVKDHNNLYLILQQCDQEILSLALDALNELFKNEEVKEYHNALKFMVSKGNKDIYSLAVKSLDMLFEDEQGAYYHHAISSMLTNKDLKPLAIKSLKRLIING